jgi:FAD/FMN-containing dehydrogenase/Fe-S oxidoreductase
MNTPPASLAAGLRALAPRLEGEIHVDTLTRALYATDASVYQETPAAVAYPRTEADIVQLIHFAREHHIGLIPRTAGTSLAGQVVGSGIVVDVSRNFTRILEIDPARRIARVQPGVIRNELNLALRSHGLFFAPETSTANRAMLGGMLGNNSCGSNSIVYGSTREHVVEVRALLGDGSAVTFGPTDAAAFGAKCDRPGGGREADILRGLRTMLGDAANRAAIRRTAPRPEIHRRNTGYALEALLEMAPFAEVPAAPPLNLCRLVAGSEGTLCFVTEITVNCEPLPPREGALVVVHCTTVDEALQANLVALRHRPYASELIDRVILECTKANLEQSRNRFFLVGDPGAILVVELRAHDRRALDTACAAFEGELRAAGLGHAYPVLRDAEMNRVWELRRAGLGLLSNIPGDARPVAVVEDTAVAPEDLPAYIREFDAMLARDGLESVHYAHAGSGEIHLRPILDLKQPDDVRRFRTVAEKTADLVRRYRGSFSGEHGDGRLRGEFVRRMVGDEVYALFVQVKGTWDPEGVFNPGKIVDTPPMDAQLRYAPGRQTAEFPTFFDFSGTRGVLRAAEMCNGSGDCRKTHLAGGTMCPSYMATRNEKDTTRARANMLRQVLTARAGERRPFDSDDLREVMDLCLSCKGCKAECPSNVDMTRLKAEFLQHDHDAHGVPVRTRAVAALPTLLRIASRAPRLFNAIARSSAGRLAARVLGFHPARALPALPPTTLRRWFARHTPAAGAGRRGRVWLLADEFTDTLDAPIGIKAVELLERLGYAVELAPVRDSGRTALSKGLLRRAARIAARNVAALADRVSTEHPLVGIEPSALLSFRDEYPALLHDDPAARARALAPHCLLIDEFLAREAEAGRIGRTDFRPAARKILLHGHCHQKALASLEPTVRVLELAVGQSVRVIPSGCCGMAGAFGYEAEHHALSMQIGELVLFPAVRGASDDAVVAAPGTSCRQQIRDGTGRTALHPIELMHELVRSG